MRMYLPTLLLATLVAFPLQETAASEPPVSEMPAAVTAESAPVELVDEPRATESVTGETVTSDFSAPAPSPATGDAILPAMAAPLGPERDRGRLTSWDAAERARTGAGVGIIIGLYNPSLATLNSIAEAFGFPGGFGSGVVYMNGIRGYGYVGPNFRIGGMVLSGSRSVIEFGEQFDRTLQADMQQGGISIEGVYPAKRWEAYAGAMVGVGSYELRYAQIAAEEPADWSEVVSRFGGTPSTDTFTKEFVAGYTALEPWVGAKYKFLPWFAVDGRVGYHWGKIGSGDWVFSDIPNFGIKGSPAVDASGISAALEITFGFFPY